MTECERCHDECPDNEVMNGICIECWEKEHPNYDSLDRSFDINVGMGES